MLHCIYGGATCYNFQILSLKVIFVLANGVDPDEMPHHAALHLGLHCFSKVHIPVYGLQVLKGLISSFSSEGCIDRFSLEMLLLMTHLIVVATAWLMIDNWTSLS